MEQDSIIRLKPEDAEKCLPLWGPNKGEDYARLFYQQLTRGERLAFVYLAGKETAGEVDLVFEMAEPGYTLPGRRIHLSRLIVKEPFRRRGIATALCLHAAEAAKSLGFSELSLGVGLDSFAALKLYHKLGFDTILFVGEDRGGRYLKLLKQL